MNKRKAEAANVWRLLESLPGFAERMKAARESLDRGEGVPFEHKHPRPGIEPGHDTRS